MDESKSQEIGMVYLVGAGPGDPGMITLAGVECLRRADVVLYDYLVNPQILDNAQCLAERICLGRHGKTRIWTQEDINAKMVELALSGKTVVRLKGGDPAVFARSAQETQVLLQQGIPFEMVPGVTAGLAVGSCVGIPLTHRDMASAVAFVTGQERANKPTPSIDYAALAKFPGTLVFYMGVTTAGQWTSTLIGAGKPADTPATIVRCCSRPDQQTIRCTLGEVAVRLGGDNPKIRPPVVVVVGEVAAHAPESWWFENRPLFGKSVLVTRPARQAAALRHTLAQLGAEVLSQPAIEISDPPDWVPVYDVLDRLDSFDWLVFSSSNGVNFLLDRLLKSGRDLRSLGGIRLAAIGPGTADELARYRLNADCVPEQFRAESLAAVLAPEATGKRFLLARASRGREVLAQQLRQAGGDVEQVVVYRSSNVIQPDEAIAQRLGAGRIDWITVTSSAIARSLSAMFGDKLHKSRLASISPITSATLRELGYEPAVEATQYTMDGVVDAIVEHD